MSWLAGYLAVINFMTWVAYGLDKGRAKRGKWRISERNLLILTAAGGSVGALAGINVFLILIAGTVLSAVVGVATGAFAFGELFQKMGEGVTSMYDITVISIIVAAIVALVREYGVYSQCDQKEDQRSERRRVRNFPSGFPGGLLYRQQYGGDRYGGPYSQRDQRRVSYFPQTQRVAA